MASITINTNLVGSYNADNVMAAIAVGVHFGVSFEDAVKAIEAYVPANKRSQMTKTERNTLIIDAYNANPTSMAAALAAFYQQIPVGHVEAGLRTHNIYSPWPEEMNRQMTGRIATYNCSPTPLSRQNLLEEKVCTQ